MPAGHRVVARGGHSPWPSLAPARAGAPAPRQRRERHASTPASDRSAQAVASFSPRPPCRSAAPHFLQNAASGSFDVAHVGARPRGAASLGSARRRALGGASVAAFARGLARAPCFARYSRATRSASSRSGRDLAGPSRASRPWPRRGSCATMSRVVGVVDLADRVLALEVLERAKHASLLLGERVDAVRAARRAPRARRAAARRRSASERSPRAARWCRAARPRPGRAAPSRRSRRADDRPRAPTPATRQPDRDAPPERALGLVRIARRRAARRSRSRSRALPALALSHRGPSARRRGARRRRRSRRAPAPAGACLVGAGARPPRQRRISARARRPRARCRRPARRRSPAAPPCSAGSRAPRCRTRAAYSAMICSRVSPAASFARMLSRGLVGRRRTGTSTADRARTSRTCSGATPKIARSASFSMCTVPVRAGHAPALRARAGVRREHDAEQHARGRRRDAARARPDARLAELELRPHADDAARR